jgi:hypothetical protein
MEADFLSVFYEMVEYHEKNVQVWHKAADELRKLKDCLLNHREQRELYRRLTVDHLDIAVHSPGLKDKLLHKLNLKIVQLDAQLRDYLLVLDEQLEQVEALSCRCEQLLASLPPSLMLYPTNSRPPLANLLERCFDIVELYVFQKHKMLVFLNNDGQDKSAFLVAESFSTFFENVGSQY